ncbi:glycosyltransferase family 8 protein [Polychaeton citri CBS 116435]|uniref:glycogenin glucosyltransferase n=1 Tax=Polychaeton citri CBS 116435 TaxID=1314669 RepID=A0A9P4Q529_9PEZI|nr:glycosyltransferase family 8 protein [Polychaeton citri CBS 116435]
MASSEDVYCTLVMTDAYLPGAAVLSHSLRDAGTKYKLACLVALDALRNSTINELHKLYDYVLPVERIPTPNPAALYLMGRPDLMFTFSKINLWRQTQFRRIVYLDADVVALRAPDELFEKDLGSAGLAAVSDVGWPDIFNTGVLVLSPNMGEYQALRTQCASGDSFDGADQGLLNQAFEHRDWRRLPFTYNCTPSASYQYEPAYRYFKRNISLVHFIGEQKPWQKSRDETGGTGAYRELLGRWWGVYDRHFGVYPQEYTNTGIPYPVTAPKENPVEAQVNRQQHQEASLAATGYPLDTPAAPAPSQHSDSHPPPEALATTTEAPFTEPGERAEEIQHGNIEPTPTVQQRRFSAPMMEWDATRYAPPITSKPEAANFPTDQYQFNDDPEPFRPPQNYPEAPKDMWYKVPDEPPRPQEKPKPIFPWEEREATKPTRRFIEDEVPPSPPKVESPPDLSFGADEFEVSADDKNVTPVTPTIQLNDQTAWQAFGAVNKNAWDEVVGIEDYVRALTKSSRNKAKVQVITPNPAPPENTPIPTANARDQHILSPANEPDPDDLERAVARRRESILVTDFPTATERPSLPVTPAPIRRNTFWGGERDDSGNLPAAEGVPDQANWDPNFQLETLRRSSLVGPGDLRLRTQKQIPDRQMPATAATIPEESAPDEGAMTPPAGDMADFGGVPEKIASDGDGLLGNAGAEGAGKITTPPAGDMIDPIFVAAGKSDGAGVGIGGANGGGVALPEK